MSHNLSIKHVQTVKVGNRAYLWVNLSTLYGNIKESRQCCYTRYNGIWCLEDGDKEPDMCERLSDKFHGKDGQMWLNYIYMNETEVYASV